MTQESKKKMMNIYVLVFGVLIAIIVIAALSTTVFNRPSLPSISSGTNLSDYGSSHQIIGIAAWINSPPINMSKLKGKVVIVDFWTYSCINCIRTIPFLNALEARYGSDGLVIIGVHTPEFQFEHNLTNVEAAVKKFNITYAVALDNNYSTWDAYGNEYWPADYVIDKNGNIRYESFGESPSSFNQTQDVIRELLQQANYTLPPPITNVTDALNFSQEISPEMYFGYQEIEMGRTNYFGDAEGLKPNEVLNYTFPNTTEPQADAIYLAGDWYSAPDSIISAGNSSEIYIIYRAKNVNIVASGNGNVSDVAVGLDGSSLNQSYLGSDDVLANGIATAAIGQSRLYNIVSAPSYGIHELEIKASPGFRIYTFTFG